MSRFTDALDAHLVNEFSASQQYIAIAVWYDDQTLPQLARHFYRQAVEERNHAMMITQYLLDADLDVRTPGIEAPQVGFDDIVAPIELALAQEKRVTEQISALAAKARDEGDYQGEQFMQWFIKEQVEEVATMTDLLRVAERSRHDVPEIEDYVAREHPPGEADDPTAPAVAGA